MRIPKAALAPALALALGLGAPFSPARALGAAGPSAGALGPAGSNLGAAGRSAGAGARLEGGPFLPYRFNRATLSSETPIRGRVEIEGRKWDGQVQLLFAGESRAATESFDTAFYLDEDFRSIEARALTVSGEIELEIDLSGMTGFGADMTAAEGELRRVMRSLYPPPRGETGTGPAAGRLSLEGMSLETAAFRALGLFKPAPRPAPLAILGAAALASILAAALPRAGSRRGRAATALCLAAALLGAGAICLASPPPLLFRAVFPTREPGLQLSGYLERRVLLAEGCELVEYGPGAADDERPSAEGGAAAAGGAAPEIADGAAVLALLPPRGEIPLDVVAPEGSRARFSPPPLVVARDGWLYSGGRTSIGWTVRESR